MSNRVFVSHVVPMNLIEKLNVSMAANYFSYNLINENCFDSVFSLVPTNISDKINGDNSTINYFQSRFLFNKGLFKIFNIFLDNIKLFKRISENSNVWFYNLTHQTILVFLLLKLFKRNTEVFVILLDFTPTSSAFSFQNFIFKQINKAKGIISLTNNEKLSKEKSIILPGIVTRNKVVIKKKEINNIFLLSGILSKNRCPELVLEAFSLFPECELIITGRIEDEDLVEKYVNNYKNIRYLGLLDYDEYLKILNNATYSINSRDPSFQENCFNFPSKTIEHLMYNKVIISTMKYTELDGINYFYVKPTLKSFITFLNELKIFENEIIFKKYVYQSDKVFDLFGVTRWKESFTKLEK